MEYTREHWQPRIATKPNRFRKLNESNDYVELINEPEAITQAGTAFTAARMNKMEAGIEGAVAGVNEIKGVVDFTGEVPTFAGNADTATKLANARKINGVSFDGSTDITIADSTKAPTSHASSATTYGASSETNYGHAKASTVAGSANGTASKGSTPTVFAQSNHVHPLQTSVSGNAGTADKWKTARNIRISDADGTNTGNAVLVDGSENETLKLPATIKANVTGNASTATAPLYQWKKEGGELFRYAAGESPDLTYYWFKVCKITTAMTFDVELCSDTNYPQRASYRLSVAKYTSGSTTKYTVALLNLGQTYASHAKLAVALDADGYLYIQTNCMWSGYLFVTLLYNDASNFSITMNRLGHAPFGSASGFTPVKIITQTGGFRVANGVVTDEVSPVINTDIIGNLTGNADTADKWKTARNISISDAGGTNTGIAIPVDGSENETLKLPTTIKANLTGNADTASKANVRVSLRHGDTWFEKTWTGLTDSEGSNVWTDGENIYYSSGTKQYVLNKATSTWVVETWTGLTDFFGSNVWTDGENIYYSSGTNQFVLNKATSTWVAKTWTGLTDFFGSSVWTDGDNIYHSSGTNQFVLNKATSTWVAKTWTGRTNFYGNNIWTDGENIYYSSSTKQYVLNKATSTWTAKTWTGFTSFDGDNIWTDGENIYYSSSTKQYVLNKATSTWTAKTWTGFTDFYGAQVWTDGDNIYFSFDTNQYVLPATRHNYIDDDKYNSLFGIVTNCNCSTLSARFVFGNE